VAGLRSGLQNEDLVLTLEARVELLCLMFETKGLEHLLRQGDCRRVGPSTPASSLRMLTRCNLLRGLEFWSLLWIFHKFHTQVGTRN
jgi:hypothetical protein